MKQNSNTQIDYTAYEVGNQLLISLECDVRVPKDDPVRLLSAIMDRVDYRRINAAYSRLGRNEYPTRLLTKVWIYGYMRRMVHTRAVEAACRENLRFMYLLEGHKAPDHNTLARFRSRVLRSEIGEDLLRQVVELLIGAGFIDMANVFIDGTKIEANANKYTFVWKKGTEKQREKLNAKVAEQLPGLLAKAGIKYRLAEEIAVRHLKKIRKKLYAQKRAEGIEFVHGSGKRKTPIQRAIETVEGWIEKYKCYTRDIHICGDRNSYCKTDHDATFMHMKEDHMRNGQLKPGYNVNVATANGFIIGYYISADRSDVQTLIPFMKKLREAYPKHHPGRVVVDSGYESEDNYCWFEELEDCELYRKKRKYRTDISRRENMAYDPDSDTYTCAAGKPIRYDHDKHSKSAGGLNITTSVYVCDHCKGCPLKEKCIRSTSPSASPPSGKPWKQRSTPRKVSCCASIAPYRPKAPSPSPSRIWIIAVSCAGARQRSRPNGRSWPSPPTSSSSIINSKMVAWERGL